VVVTVINFAIQFLTCLLSLIQAMVQRPGADQYKSCAGYDGHRLDTDKLRQQGPGEHREILYRGQLRSEPQAIG